MRSRQLLKNDAIGNQWIIYFYTEANKLQWDYRNKRHYIQTSSILQLLDLNMHHTEKDSSRINFIEQYIFIVKRNNKVSSSFELRLLFVLATEHTLLHMLLDIWRQILFPGDLYDAAR